ncbi:MAG: TonB-dependent receptor plug domain-containing protein [Gemmatimonadaceae bacterium]
MKRLRTPAALAGWAIVPVALSFSLHAQEPPRPDTTRADTARLAPVVVTATRIPVALNAPIAPVSVITGEELRARGITSLADALRAVPGAVVTPSGSFGATTSLFLRGGESDYVRVLVDGIPVNDPGGVFDLSALSTDNIDRIEVVRGPVSVLYGSEAVTGVVQVFTRRGESGPRLQAAARGGSHGSLDAGATVLGGGEEGGVPSYSIGAAHHTTDGILPFNNRYYNTVVSGAGRLAFGAWTDVQLSLRGSRSRYHYPTNSFGALTDSNAFRDSERLALGFEVGHRFTPRVDARLTLSSSQVDARNDDRSDSPGDTLGSYGFISHADVYRRSVGARVNVRLMENGVLTLGAEHERQRETSSFESLSEFGPFAASFRARRRNTAGYAQLVGDLGERISYSAGLRHDDNQRFGPFTTYRVSVGAEVAPATRLRAALGAAFKEPSFLESFAGSGLQENRDLEPERSRSWELGVERDVLSDRLRLAATYFDQRFRDLIQFTPLPAGTGFFGTFRNLPAARSRGVELQSRLTTAPGLSAGASYTWLRTRVTDAGAGATTDSTFVSGERLLRRPTHLASLDLGYTSAARGSIALAANYVGKRDDLDFSKFPAPRIVLPAYTRVDLSAEAWITRRTRATPLALTVRIENLFDESYEPVYNFRAPGRTILAGARVGR